MKNYSTNRADKSSAIHGQDDFISGLSNSEKDALFSQGIIRKYKKEQMIFSAGSSSDELYVLINGRAKVYELSREGKEVILWFCFPGELFGLADVMRRQNYSRRLVNAQACCNIEVLTLSQHEFIRYLYQHPGVALRVIDLLCYRMRELGDMLLNLVSDDVSSRVIKLIMRLATRYGRTAGEEINLNIPLTHQEMADMIGTSRQTVTMVLGNLRREGILKIQQRTIVIQSYSRIKHKLAQIEPRNTSVGDGNIQNHHDVLRVVAGLS